MQLVYWNWYKSNLPKRLWLSVIAPMNYVFTDTFVNTINVCIFKLLIQYFLRMLSFLFVIIFSDVSGKHLCLDNTVNFIKYWRNRCLLSASVTYVQGLRNIACIQKVQPFLLLTKKQIFGINFNALWNIALFLKIACPIRNRWFMICAYKYTNKLREHPFNLKGVGAMVFLGEKNSVGKLDWEKKICLWNGQKKIFC